MRETAYLYPDEEEALEERARKARCSKSEIIRRALRQYLDMEESSVSSIAGLSLTGASNAY